NSSAQSIVRYAESELEVSRDDCQKTLTDLGQLKVEAVQVNIHNFLEEFKKIKNKDDIGDAEIGNLQLSEFTAGPALLVAGWYMGAKAESKVNDALSNLAEAERFKVDIDSA
ncbi:hypothetical protein, partial [Klebsiella pneumoniae]|uniref:hypothetical protein n=1 Tax=Klebsiella pneumoniae TaxID=573 RepID=UPI001C4E1B02